MSQYVRCPIYVYVLLAIVAIRVTGSNYTSTAIHGTLKCKGKCKSRQRLKLKSGIVILRSAVWRRVNAYN
jgi:hypothetical protein